MRKLIIGSVTLGLLAIVACGSEGDDAGPAPAADGGGDTGTSSGSSGFVPEDSGTNETGPTTPTSCPSYQTLCEGRCLPTTDDAEHCGDCTTKCTGAQACSAGKCSDTCQTGLEICANRCVDKQSDNAHCGACGNACAAGQGCVAGTCVNAVVVGPAPGKCAGGGPPITNDAAQGGCLGQLAQKTFRWSLCSCTDVTFSSALTADAYDSTKGPYVPGSTGGGVGVNREERASGTLSVGGDLWIHGTGGSSVTGVHRVRHDLRVNGKLTTAKEYTVENDAWINGDLTATSDFTVANELKVPADRSISANVTAGTTTRAAVEFPAPCDCSEPQLVPVNAIVAAHTGTNNDNAAINLAANALVNPGQPTRLDLPCGEYFLTGIGGSSPITVAAHGRTALYIDGDINLAGDLAFIVDPTGELDLFVTGTVTSSQALTIGSPNYPALSRAYLGTAGTFALSSNIRVAGNLWVGKGSIAWSATSDMFGSLFTGDFTASSPTTIHYDRAVLQAGKACDGAGGGGGGGAACTSCRDCNNQACKGGQCGACTTSADCCSPLVCSGGECVAAVK